MEKSRRKNEKILIYQVLPRLFGNTNGSPVANGTLEENGCGKFSDFTPETFNYIKSLGMTHVWYTGVLEHATQTHYPGIEADHPAVVKGKAGSPYAVKDYYDIDPDLADNVAQRIDEFESLVKRTHAAGLKVVIDFVPNHVARHYVSDAKPPFVQDFGHNDVTNQAFLPSNNFYYIPNQPLSVDFGDCNDGVDYSEYPAKVTGNDCFSFRPSQNDWYETVKLNYGVDYQNGHTCYFNPIPDTWLKMKEILLYWAAKGIDAFRCDMAEMVPVEFWQWVIAEVKKCYDVLFIAEVYDPSRYRDYIHRGGFDYLYDKVGLYDTLREVMTGRRSAREISYCWQSIEGIQSNMLNFIENHDEQRVASDFFAGSALPGIPATIVASLMNVNPYMLYFGQELGERGMDSEGFSGRDGRTTIFDYWSVPTVRELLNNRYGKPSDKAAAKLLERYRQVLTFASTDTTVAEGQFYDLMSANLYNNYMNIEKQYAFIRKSDEAVLLVVANFDGYAHDIRLRLPEAMFEAMGIEPNCAAEVEDVLNQTKSVSTLTPEWGYGLHLEAYDGAILKFVYK